MENEIHEILEQSFESLELYAVLEEAAAYCQSEPGRAELLSSTPTEDDEAFLEQMKLVSQWKEVLQLSGPLGFSGVIPLNVLLDNLRVDASRVLNPEEILSVLDIVSTAATVSYRLGRLDERYDILKAQKDLLLPMDQLRRDINRVIDEHGEVRSDASPELIRIRNKGAKTRDRVRKRLESIVRDRDLARIVQEDYITQRNDRYVILLRPEFKGLLEGIIHDHSRSGSSFYVEPFQVVELNNEVAGIEDEEREEIRRIFIELTDKIREASPELYANFKTLKRLDAFQARAIYAREIEGIEPEISGQGFRILAARHPLLIASGTQVVPMDIIQEPDTKATIISGANMGGKTVALKIAGLFPLMVRCGLLIPVQEGTKIAPFQRVMADIGDDQDIRGKVSSFSGHMLRIKSIVENASIGDLVLLDELGGATDPDEGSALAMAIVDELVEKGVRGTHYNPFDSPEVLRTVKIIRHECECGISSRHSKTYF